MLQKPKEGGNGKQVDVTEAFQMVVNISQKIQVTRHRLETAQKNMELEQKTLDSLMSQREGMLLDVSKAITDAQGQELVQLQQGIKNQENLKKGKETNK